MIVSVDWLQQMVPDCNHNDDDDGSDDVML